MLPLTSPARPSHEYTRSPQGITMPPVLLLLLRGALCHGVGARVGEAVVIKPCSAWRRRRENHDVHRCRGARPCCSPAMRAPRCARVQGGRPTPWPPSLNLYSLSSMYEEHDVVQTPTTEERKCRAGLESNPMERALRANKK